MKLLPFLPDPLSRLNVTVTKIDQAIEITIADDGSEAWRLVKARMERPKRRRRPKGPKGQLVRFDR